MKQTKFHYAWVVCGACTLLMICNMGLCSNIFTVYLPFIQESGISGGKSSTILSVRCLFSFLSTFFVSYYYRKIPLKLGVGISILLNAAAALVFSLGGSAAVYFTGAAIAGVAYGLGSTIPMSLLMTRWFDRRRGLAIGICSSGSGLATVIFSPILTALASRAGLRAAFLFHAGFVLASGVLILSLIRENPAALGLTPYGAGEVERSRREHGAGMGRAGWVLAALAMVVIGGSGQAASTHLSILATSSGYSVGTAALAASVYGLCLTAGKFLFGAFADRVGTKRASVYFFLIFMLGCALPLGMNGANRFLCLAFAVVLGLGCPIFAVGVPLWAVDLSTEAGYPATLKWFELFYAAGGILFSAVPGIIFDHTGEYQSSYVLFGVSIFCSLLALLGAYRASGKVRTG